MSLPRFTWPLLLLVCQASGAWAQGVLHDPMAPPPGAVPVAPADRPAADAGTGPLQARVQVLVIGADRKHVVLDGRLLKPGEHMDQWRLVRINNSGVVMQSEQGPQTLSAFPAVNKKMITEGQTSVSPPNAKP